MEYKLQLYIYAKYSKGWLITTLTVTLTVPLPDCGGTHDIIVSV